MKPKLEPAANVDAAVAVLRGDGMGLGLASEGLGEGGGFGRGDGHTANAADLGVMKASEGAHPQGRPGVQTAGGVGKPNEKKIAAASRKAAKAAAEASGGERKGKGGEAGEGQHRGVGAANGGGALREGLPRWLAAAENEEMDESRKG